MRKSHIPKYSEQDLQIHDSNDFNNAYQRSLEQQRLLPETSLVQMAGKGNIEMLQYVLTQCSSDIKAKVSECKTLVHAAVLGGHQEMVLFLIEIGADMHAKDDRGYTPLHLAAKLGRYEVFKQLAERSNRLFETTHAYNALVLAIEGNFHDIFEYLLVKGSVDHRSEILHALFLTKKIVSTDILARLLDNHDFDVNMLVSKSKSMLCLCAGCGNVAAVKFLLQYKDIKPNDGGPKGRVPLIEAVQANRYAVVQELLACRLVDVNALGRGYYHGGAETALHIATDKGNAEIVRILLAREDIEINKKDYFGRTSLHGGGAVRLRETTKLLLEHKDIDVNNTDKEGGSPLHFATRYGLWSSVEFLIHHENIDVNITNTLGQSPLHLAARYGYWNNLEFLIHHKDIDVNIPDNSGRTPLHTLMIGLAYSRQRPEGVENDMRKLDLLLMYKDIKVNIRDNDGKTALRLAKAMNLPEAAIALLESHGAVV